MKHHLSLPCSLLKNTPELSIRLRRVFQNPARLLTLVLGLVFALIAFSFPAEADPLSVGSPAPMITAMNQAGDPVHFADVYKKGVTLVYFYPKAGTTGCTAEACSIRDSYSSLAGEGLQIIGVSRDTQEAQKEFMEKYNLPFTLIADTDGSVAKAFGVPMLGFGMLPYDARQSFIIKNGKIAWNSLKAQTDGSAQEVQKALDHLDGSKPQS